MGDQRSACHGSDITHNAITGTLQRERQVFNLRRWHLRNADHVIDERTWDGLKTGKAFVFSLASSQEIVEPLEDGVVAQKLAKGHVQKEKMLRT